MKYKKLMKGFQFSASGQISANAIYLTIAAGSFISICRTIWRSNNRELERNITHLTWIKEHPPQYSTLDEMSLVNTELERQLEFKRNYWFPLFQFPPTVDWAEIPMDEAFCKKFY